VRERQRDREQQRQRQRDTDRQRERRDRDWPEVFDVPSTNSVTFEETVAGRLGSTTQPLIRTSCVVMAKPSKLPITPPLTPPPPPVIVVDCVGGVVSRVGWFREMALSRITSPSACPSGGGSGSGSSSSGGGRSSSSNSGGSGGDGSSNSSS
jgi:hypothetical protein